MRLANDRFDARARGGSPGSNGAIIRVHSATHTDWTGAQSDVGADAVTHRSHFQALTTAMETQGRMQPRLRAKPRLDARRLQRLDRWHHGQSRRPEALTVRLSP